MRVCSAVVLSLILATAASATEVYFSPSPECENKIVELIQGSQLEIVAAVYSINNKKIVEALEVAKKRGVKVRVLTDYVQASQRNSKVFQLIASGIDLRVHTKFKIEHNKFGVYDGKHVSTGSFNWTGPASRSNSENCLFLSDAPVVTKYKERFEFLWQKNTSDGSKAKLAKLASKGRGVSSKH